MFDSVKTDYFAVSLPDLLIWEDDLRKRHMLHCKYLIGLGNLGLGCAEEANKTFAEIIEVDCYHVGSRIHINLVNVV
jgi:hypothetical protein